MDPVLTTEAGCEVIPSAEIKVRVQSAELGKFVDSRLSKIRFLFILISLEVNFCKNF